MKLVCETCKQTLTSLAAWRDHLPGEIHQQSSCKRSVAQIPTSPDTTLNTVTLRVPPFLLWTNEANERAVVVTEFKNIVTDPVELLNHFCSFGFISDFIFDSQQHFAVVLYDDISSVEALHRTKWSNFMKSKMFRLRRKSHLSAVEWIILIELDGKYKKEDQQFFINHAEMSRSIATQQIAEQLQSFIERTSLGPDDITVRQTIMRDVAYIIRQAYPKVYIYPLQPLVKGLIDVDEVFDMYMDPFSTCGASTTPPNVPDYKLQEMQGAAIRILFIIQNQTVVPGYEKYCSEVTVVPEDALMEQGDKIIRGINFFHRGTGVRCKISFDAVMEANVSSLISFLLTLDARILPFLRFLRYWARIHRFTYRNKDTVCTMTMLAIVYLVRKNIVPSICVLQQLIRNVPANDMSAASTQHRPYFVEGWDVSFIKDVIHVEAYMMTRGKMPFVEEATPESSLHDLFNPTFLLGPFGTRSLMTLLSEFFEAFAMTDWNKYVISPFLGEILPREMFAQGQEGTLPVSLNLYKMRSVSSRLDIGEPLIVQHPFRLGHNVGKNMDLGFVLDLKKAFQDTTDLIKKVLSSPSPKIISMFPPIHALLRRQATATEREFESSDSDRSHDSGIPVESLDDSNSNPLSYSFVAKKAALLPPPQVTSKSKHSNHPRSRLSSSRSASTRDANSTASKMMKFEVNKRFQETFMTACLGLANESRLKDRLKTLAIVFMRDFVWSVWGRCFYLHTTSVKVPDTEQKFHDINKMFMEQFPASQLVKSLDASDSSMSDIPDDDCSWPNDSFEEADGEEVEEDQWRDVDSDEPEEDLLPEPEQQTGKRPPSTKDKKYTKELYRYGRKQCTGTSKISSPCKAINLSEKEKVDQLIVKLDKIPKSACKNYCQVMRLHGYQKIWSNRRGVRAALTLHDRLSKQLILKETSSTSAVSDSVSACLINPFEKEEAVTRAVLEGVVGWGKSPSKRAIWSFTVIIRIDTTKELPTLFMSIKEGRNPYVCQNMINYFGNNFQSIFSDYMAYRLNKWLDGNGSVQQVNSSPTQK